MKSILHRIPRKRLTLISHKILDEDGQDVATDCSDSPRVCEKCGLIRVIEFFVVGLLFGLIEDLIAIMLATDAKIDLRVIFIVLGIAFPFAFFSEVIVAHPLFWEVFLPKKVACRKVTR